MPNDEGELNESEEALTKSIAIILENIIKIYHSFPKKLFTILLTLSGIITFISSIFEYDKVDLDTITLDIILNSFILKILILFIIISFVVSLIKGFYNYIDKNEKRISKMKQDSFKSYNDYTDKLELIKEQNVAQPIFIGKYLIKNMIREIENYINLIENKELINKYLHIIEIKLVNNRIIEIVASNDGNSIIAERMIFEIWRKKQVVGSLVEDSYGVVSVLKNSENTFKSILIDSQPEIDFWDKMFEDLRENTFKRVDNFYLKIYIPEEISQTNKDTLDNLLTGLNQL